MINNKPLRVFQHGACRASIFVNHAKKAAHRFEVPKVVVSKSSQDSRGTWKGSSSFDLNDVPKLVAALNRAYQHLSVNKKAEEALSGKASQETVEE
jgi:hypothetical protein